MPVFCRIPIEMPDRVSWEGVFGGCAQPVEWSRGEGGPPDHGFNMRALEWLTPSVPPKKC